MMHPSTAKIPALSLTLACELYPLLDITDQNTARYKVQFLNSYFTYFYLH